MISLKVHMTWTVESRNYESVFILYSNWFEDYHAFNLFSSGFFLVFLYNLLNLMEPFPFLEQNVECLKMYVRSLTFLPFQKNAVLN